MFREKMTCKKELFFDVLEIALTGGDFAEIFVEEQRANVLQMENGKLESSSSSLTFGLGLRIINGHHATYTYTSDLREENLFKLAKESAKVSGKAEKNIVQPFKDISYKEIHKVKEMPRSVEKLEKIDILRRAADVASKENNDISQTTGGIADRVQDVLICNSDGLFVFDTRVYSRLNLGAVASSQTEKQQAGVGPGAHAGYEFIRGLNIEELAKETARTASTMLHADLCPSGKMPVVLDDGFGGVIFHEACGHGLEANSVAKGNSVFAGKLGEQIANPKVTAIDDGTIPNAWGSLHIDDEGEPTERKVLIKDGILQGYMVDKLNGRMLDMKANGSSRRQSYKYAPTSRMSNTYIDGGTDTKEEIINSIEYGLYAKRMGGGSVQPSTGDFNFAVTEAYIIRNGKIAEPVRGATLIGKGHEVIKNIDMITPDVRREQGMCGSRSGSIPTDVGQPLLRVKEITVGGRSESNDN